MSHAMPDQGGRAETLSNRRAGHPFFPPAERQIPALNTANTPPAAGVVLYEHYVYFDNEWWVAEYDPTTGLARGYVYWGDPHIPKWDEFSLVDLEALIDNGTVVERNPLWTPTPANAANLPDWRV